MLLSLFRNLKTLLCNLRFRFHNFVSSQRLYKLKNSVATYSAVDEISKAEHLLREETCEWLRINLRRTPYWKEGHLALAEHSIGIDDIASAYASAHAALILSATEGEKSDCRALLAKTYLKRGLFDEAQKTLSEIVDQFKSFEMMEDLAAAYFGLGKTAEATAVLLRIPEDKLSIEARAALRYAQGKCDAL